VVVLAAHLSRAEIAVDLTPKNFAQTLFYDTRRPTFVMFYTRGSPEGEALTKAIEPAWKELSDEYAGSDQILIATVDCNPVTKGMALCDKYLGKPNKFPIPTLMYWRQEYSDVEKDPDVYEGGRTPKALKLFAQELLCQPATLDGCSPALQKEIAPLAAMPTAELRALYDDLRKQIAKEQRRRQQAQNSLFFSMQDKDEPLSARRYKEDQHKEATHRISQLDKKSGRTYRMAKALVHELPEQTPTTAASAKGKKRKKGKRPKLKDEP